MLNALIQREETENRLHELARRVLLHLSEEEIHTLLSSSSKTSVVNSLLLSTSSSFSPSSRAAETFCLLYCSPRQWHCTLPTPSSSSLSKTKRNMKALMMWHACVVHAYDVKRLMSNPEVRSAMCDDHIRVSSII